MKLLIRIWCALAVMTLACYGRKTEDKTYTIAVIPKGTTHEFWKSIHAGAEKAAQELGTKGVQVKLIWKGPFREDDRDQQIQVVRISPAARSAASCWPHWIPRP